MTNWLVAITAVVAFLGLLAGSQEGGFLQETFKAGRDALIADPEGEANRRELEELRVRQEQANKDLKEAKKLQGQLEARVKDLSNETMITKGELAKAVKAKSEAEAARKSAEAQAAQLAASRQALEAQAADREKDLAQARGENGSLQKALAKANSKSAAQDEAIKELEERFEATDSARREAEADAEAAKLKAEAAEKSLAEAAEAARQRQQQRSTRGFRPVRRLLGNLLGR